MRRMLALALWLATPAWASFERPQRGEIALRDLPGTRGAWQEARALVDAPPERVRAWLVEFDRWPQRFRDVVAVRVVGRAGDVTQVWMRSRLIGGALVVEVLATPTAIFYRGQEGRVSTSGRIFLTASGPGRTDVILQTTARVGGLRGALVPRDLIRSRARAKLTSDLRDLIRLAREARR